jgi:ketosteroid isomerase-like protein
MREPIRSAVVSIVLLVGASACSAPPPSDDPANAGLDSLNARLVQAYRTHDPEAYAALFTDSAVFEWPAFQTVRGPAELAGMARTNWATLKDMDLRLAVASRRLAPDHATEFGAFEQSFTDSSGVRRTEFGRYAALFARGEDGSWRMDRFFGFADSTTPAPASR